MELRDFLRRIKALKRVIMLISMVFPRNRDILVFGTESGVFADNAKYMYLEVSRKTDKRAIWIADTQRIANKLKENGLRSYTSDSLKGKFCCLRAKYGVVDRGGSDLPSWYSQGVEIVNLWHGFPYKHIEGVKDIENPETFVEKFILYFRDVFYSDSFFLHTETLHENLFNDVSEGEKIYAGYPRNDIFFEDIEGAQIGSKNLEEDYILYMPTYRDYEDFEDAVDLEELDKAAGNFEDDLDIVIKPHPLSKISQDFENLKVIEESIDVYPVMKKSRALITDYSSVMFDYMHTGKPVIRYQFDKKEYEKKRGLNDEVKHLLPGKEVKTIKGLKEALENLDEIDIDYEDKINEVFECRKEGFQAGHILNQID